ncbi:MAG: noncanonical pyrimidine nucleotidase, YjjG family protein [Cyclobacteriaceae bacterium]|nr:MAG: noncanonical pyrimidine nucleotidase, YjjG family protein [Cyclobacteriaceae bacterium]
MNKNYRCIFFDLDHTLWDYETNSVTTLKEMFWLFGLHTLGSFGFNDFCTEFGQVNRQLWHLYDTGKIDSAEIRKSRFELILNRLGVVNNRLAQDLSAHYLAECPKKTALMPGATETLQYLKGRYRLSVITNGFNDVQLTKLTHTNLLPFFDHVVTSEQVGSKKPSPEIFRFALNKNRVLAREAIMVGDNPLTDIAGAAAAEIDAVLFSPDKPVQGCHALHQIHHLAELRTLL